MSQDRSSGLRRRRLRIFFDDAMVSFDLPADATFEDVALRLRTLPSSDYGQPLAIDVVSATSLKIVRQSSQHLH